jgi:uncharacterized Fe-S cluster protein YjdI
MKEMTRHYSNGEVTVVWKPHLCRHSAVCVVGLPAVFDATRSPWINIEGASTDDVIVQVKQCPSGALSYVMNSQTKEP